MQPHPRDIQRIARDGLRKCAFIHRQRTPARGKEQDKDQRAFHAQTVGESGAAIKGNFRGGGRSCGVRVGCAGRSGTRGLGTRGLSPTLRRVGATHQYPITTQTG